MLVEFLPGQTPGWEFFVWHEELEAILGYKVDLFSKLSRWIEPVVRQEALLLYLEGDDTVSEVSEDKEEWDALDKLIETCALETGITDLARQHDHYLYGKPKQD